MPQSRLSTLPTELRLQIYDHTLLLSSPLSPQHQHGPGALLRVCRQFRNEAANQYHARDLSIIIREDDDTKAAISWLQHTDPILLARIKRLIFLPTLPAAGAARRPAAARRWQVSWRALGEAVQCAGLAGRARVSWVEWDRDVVESVHGGWTDVRRGCDSEGLGRSAEGRWISGRIERFREGIEMVDWKGWL